MRPILHRLFLSRVLPCVLASVLSAPGLTLAQDQPAAPGIVISTGQQGGGYWSAGERLREVAAQSQVEVENLDSSGSLKNLERLFSQRSPVSLAFAQADALQYYLDGNRGAESQVEQLQTIGEECVFIIGEAKRKIKDTDDMAAAPRMQLGIKSPKSGIWVTFNQMTKMAPELQSVSLVYGDPLEMIQQLLSHLTNVDRAVMVVHGTNAHSPEIDMAAAEPDKFRFIKIEDERFTRPTDTGEPIYHRKKVESSVASEIGKVETICVRGLLLANRSKMSEEQYREIGEIIATRWNQIHPED